MPGTAPYAELHCHSAYSFLDGASLPQELAVTAQQLGYDALALTDHNSVSGSMELAMALKNVPLRAIHGAEVDLRAGAGDGTRHLTLLARDARGWRNLCRILTQAHSHTRLHRERSEPWVTPQTVLEHADGLVCLTGCAEHGVHDDRTARRLLDAFGPQGLRVELQRPYARSDRARNRALAALARRLGVACVATGDVHAHAHARAPLQDAFVALRSHTTLDASEPLRRGNRSHVMSSRRRWPAVRRPSRRGARDGGAGAGAALRSDKDLGYRYPGAEDAELPRRLVELCRARLTDRYSPPDGVRRALPSRRAASGAGARVIEKLGLAGFFLLHHDLLQMAREVAAEVRGPGSARALLAPGRGRGSSVSSIVCYLTGLSHIDPVANGLQLGRFLHEELRRCPISTWTSRATSARS